MMEQEDKRLSVLSPLTLETGHRCPGRSGQARQPARCRPVDQHENLKNYRVSSRRYRNRRIGEFLKELHLTEGRNTGFQKIIRALKANGSPMPIFETDEERTCFLTTFLIHPEFITSDEGRNDGRNEGRNDPVNMDLTDNEQLVLNTIRLDEHVTMVKMAEQTGMSKATVERVVKAMKEKNIIGREGSTQKGKWIILK